MMAKIGLTVMVGGNRAGYKVATVGPA